MRLYTFTRKSLTAFHTNVWFNDKCVVAYKFLQRFCGVRIVAFSTYLSATSAKAVTCSLSSCWEISVCDQRCSLVLISLAVWDNFHLFFGKTAAPRAENGGKVYEVPLQYNFTSWESRNNLVSVACGVLPVHHKLIQIGWWKMELDWRVVLWFYFHRCWVDGLPTIGTWLFPHRLDDRWTG